MLTDKTRLDPNALDRDQYILYAWHRQESDQEVKIGKSTVGRLYNRITSAQTDNPYPIQFIGIHLVDADNQHEMKIYEDEMLSYFNKVRDDGEWVYYDESVKKWIDTYFLKINYEDFIEFHREKTRRLRKKPGFVERENRATRERRANQRVARRKPNVPVVEVSEVENRAKRSGSSSMRRRRSNMRERSK